MQICHLLLHHSETFDVLHVFLPLTIAELSALKQVQFFWPTLYNAESWTLKEVSLRCQWRGRFSAVREEITEVTQTS